MQDKYVGDIGDFGKYALLKTLCGQTETRDRLSLGVVWYRTFFPDEKSDDGKHTRYLLNPGPRDIRELKACDPDLYDALFGIVDGKRRAVRAIREQRILAHGTVYHEDLLSFDEMPFSGKRARDARLAHRQEWLDSAVKATRDCAVVFLDPDNGLEVKSCPRYGKRGPKYVFFSELTPFVEGGKSVIIYQHIDHSQPAKEQVKRRLSQLKDRFVGCAIPFGLLFHRGTARAFLVIPSSHHADTLIDRATRFLSGRWGELGHFDQDVISLGSSSIR